VQEHGPHEGRMRSRIVSDDGSTLIHDDRNEARTEIKGPVHAGLPKKRNYEIREIHEI